MNSIFETIKACITPIQVAERYGLKISRSGMACCPFHEDKTPSMKLNETYYYCFGCQASGDVVDLVAKLHGLTQMEAAKKIAAEFGIDISQYEKKKNTSAVKGRTFVPFKYDAEALEARLTEISKRAERQNLSAWVCHAQQVLIRYQFLLRYWKERYAPNEMDPEWHPLFLKALQQEDYIEYLLDQAYLRDEYEQSQFYQIYCKDVNQIDERVLQYTNGTESRSPADDGRAA